MRISIGHLQYKAYSLVLGNSVNLDLKISTLFKEEVLSMEVTKTKDFRICYILDEKKVREIASIIQEFSKEININVSCIEGTSMTFTELKKFIEYPNRKEKQYKEIEITNEYTSSVKVRIRFTNLESSTVSYRISGDEKDVDHYSMKIEGVINSIKQWYSWVISIYGYIVNAVIFNGLGLLIIMLMEIDNFAIISLIIFGCSIISIPSSLKWKYYLFPVGAFALGDGADRIKNLKSKRNIIFSGIFLAGIVAYTVNQIPSLFK